MIPADGVMKFGEWLPDLPELDNPGIIDLNNVLPMNGCYLPFFNLNGQGYSDALASRPFGAILVNDQLGTGGRVYVGLATVLRILSASGTTWGTLTPAVYNAVTEYLRFAQFDDFCIVTSIDNIPNRSTISTGSVFVALALTGTAPRARQICVIGRFVMLGDTTAGTAGSGQHHLQWPAIDDPTNWQTPGTAAAQSVQAGEQFLPSELGQIRGLAGGDQFGVALQKSGVTRITYVGGALIFQFDTIERRRGCFYPNSVVQIGELTFFADVKSLLVTDGVRVEDIGEGKVSRFFAGDVDPTQYERMYGGVDLDKKLIYWIYPNTSAIAGRPNRVLLYNYEEKRFSKASPDIEAHVLFTGRRGTAQSTASLNAIDENFVVSRYLGDTESPMYITVAEKELHPGARTHVDGVMPRIEGVGAGNTALFVALGAREASATSPTFTSEVLTDVRTGFAPFRSDSQYHRARVTHSGGFQKAVGLSYRARPAGNA